VPKASEALVYVIEHDEAVRDSLKVLIESNGFRVRDFATKETFLLSTEPDAGSCLVLGFSRYGADAVKNLRSLRKHRPNLPIIFVVGQSSAFSSAATCSDAFAQLERPVQEAALVQAIQRAFEH
jgi:FixJ family two-component response regulator